MKKLFILLATIVATVISIDAYAQQAKIVGRVVHRSIDNIVTPISGASVLEKGTTNGTVTDLEGLFTLYPKTSKPTLKISFVGFTLKEIIVRRKPNQGSTIDLGDIIIQEDLEVISAKTVNTVPTKPLVIPNRQ